ncbi:HIT family protein [Filimonas effusa]|uniref:HIT family protein n=1 Tax=Filimonas effusa TaxID=2508721 RepID=A0A4Q1D6S1_9BACT|nr:HIT family protein [Filimonas effusa]RXK83367.1 HIT family protein [Filimonas effusa]
MTLFSKIIAGEIPCYRIAENDKFFAFLDIFPATPGHTLVVPKIETDRLFDLPAGYLSELLPFAQPLAQAIQKAFPCDRVNILTLGFEVPHAHVHLLPMNGMADADIMASKQKATPGELEHAQKQILAHL